MSDWTTPAAIRERVMRDWQRGRLLAAALAGEALYPWRIALKGPAAATLAECFDEARQWIRSLAESEKTQAGAGYRLEYQEIRHRQLGRNRLPVAAWLDTEADALALIGKRREAARFRELAGTIVQAFPQLHDWIVRRPLRVLEQADDWPGLLGVLRWLAEHPRPNVYLRQIDLPGVHTKFIEQNRSLLAELLDRILPAEAINASAARGAGGFEQRYGLRAKPVPIRFRLLGGQRLQGLSDLSVPGEEFARLALPVRRVFITENEINFLAFPEVPEGMAIFGAGYGFEPIAGAGWLADRDLCYWGDIDSHGFAILDQLRSRFPQARALLMDRDTLLAHRALWGREDAPTRRDLSRLRPEEASLYDDLRHDRLGPAIRLEQERIGFAWVQAALAGLESEP